MLAVRPNCNVCTLTAVMTGGKPVEPPQALRKAIKPILMSSLMLSILNDVKHGKETETTRFYAHL